MGRNRACFSALELSLLYSCIALSLCRSSSQQLQPSEVQSLLSIQSLLEFPSVLSGWNNWTSFCTIPPTPSLAVICNGDSVTELRIVGNKGPVSRSSRIFQSFSVTDRSLSSLFSIDSVFEALSKLPSLKELTLVSLGLWGTLPTKISLLSSLQMLNMSSNFIYGYIPRRVALLSNLQTLALDNNMLYGSVPSWVTSLHALSVLDLSCNALNGSFPSSFGTSERLRVMVLSVNHLSGPVPDLSGLVNLEVLDLGGNLLGPKFPSLGSKLVEISLDKNMFTYNIPPEIKSFDKLQKFDVSYNQFSGPILPSLFSLPSIQYLNLSGNKLTGQLPVSTECSSRLQFVNLSNNRLVGSLPKCLRTNSSKITVSYSGNCLNNTSSYQHQYSFCRNEPLAAIPRPIRKKGTPKKLILLLGVAGGVVLAAIAIGLLVLVVFRRCKSEKDRRQKATIITASAGSGPFLTNSKYISQTMRLGPLGLPPYRIFTIEELEEATDHFDELNIFDEGSLGELFRGRLNDGSLVAVRGFRVKQKHTVQSMMQYVEPLSKFRHQNLVSTLGHCIVCHPDSQNVKMVYLVFEFVPNGSLSGVLYGSRKEDTVNWPQRVTLAMGISRGVKFLHTGIVPGNFGNDLKAENILLDQNFTPKICKYKLPMPLKSVAAKEASESPFSESQEIPQPDRSMLNACNPLHFLVSFSEAFHTKYSSLLRFITSINWGEKSDVYRLGIILLELIVGRHITTQSELDMLRKQMNLISDTETLEAIDASIRYSCSYASIRAAIDITMKCLAEDPNVRPSVEDIIWHLQYSAQIQEGSTTNTHVDDYPDLHL